MKFEQLFVFEQVTLRGYEYTSEPVGVINFRIKDILYFKKLKGLPVGKVYLVMKGSQVEHLVAYDELLKILERKKD